MEGKISLETFTGNKLLFATQSLMDFINKNSISKDQIFKIITDSSYNEIHLLYYKKVY
jgi:hypothetical protein